MIARPADAETAYRWRRAFEFVTLGHEPHYDAEISITGIVESRPGVLALPDDVPITLHCSCGKETQVSRALWIKLMEATPQ